MFIHQDLQNDGNFRALEAVDRGSDPQLQVREIFFFYCSTLRVKLHCILQMLRKKQGTNLLIWGSFK